MRVRGVILAILTAGAGGMLGGCAGLGSCGAPDCRDDGRITRDVQARLAQDPSLSGATPIYAQTRNHVVYLHGLADTPFEQREAEVLARQVPGVTDVVNQIGLTGGAH